VGGIMGSSGITTGGLATTISSCVALNPSITGEGSTHIHRVLGNINGTKVSIANNYAWYNMTVTATGYTANKSADKPDGQDITIQPDQTFYEGLDWDFTGVWKMDTYGYPMLQWQTTDTPREPL
jgi:hypothetical protein